MPSHLAILVISLVALVKGADLLVANAARIARRFHVSDLVVGLIITSVGTSLPELASSLAAALAGSPGLVIGNVLGSNIANIGLVLGLAAIVRPFDTAPKVYDRDGFIMVASAAVLFAVALDNHLGRVEATAFLMIYVAYTAFAVRTDREGVRHRFKDFLEFMFDFEYAAPVARGLRRHAKGTTATDGVRDRNLHGVWREIVPLVLALAALIVGARFAVSEAVRFAELLGVPENLVGLSLIAVGTSLPELSVAVTAARRGNADMVVGNVLGSNIANILLILGLSGLVRPLDVPELSVVYTIPIMLFFSIALLHFIRSDWRISRAQGAIALVAYLGFLAAAFLQGWG